MEYKTKMNINYFVRTKKFQPNFGYKIKTTEMTAIRPQIVFVHGMFVTNKCWKNWLPYFEGKGYECFAPAWPYKNDSPENLLKRHPDYKGEGNVHLKDVITSFEKFIIELPQPPILIGHSMGALVVQLLLQKGLGSCAVVIDSAPPQGVLSLEFSFLKANWPVLNPFMSKYKPCLWTEDQFCFAFADHLSGQELLNAFNDIVPQGKLVPRDSLKKIAKINYSKKQQPLLFIAGEKDKIIPASLNQTNWSKYRKAPSKTDYKVFTGRRHNLIMDKGWDEIAEFISNWLGENRII